MAKDKTKTEPAPHKGSPELEEAKTPVTGSVLPDAQPPSSEADKGMAGASEFETFGDVKLKKPTAPEPTPDAAPTNPVAVKSDIPIHHRHIYEAMAKGKLPKEVSLPPEKETLRGTPMEAVLRNWREQEKRGLIKICTEEGCYYPVKAFQSDETGNVPLHHKVMRGGKAVYPMVGQCTWDPRHAGGEQLIYPPAKDDDI